MSGEVWSFGDAWVYNATSVLASVPCSSDLNSRPQITVSQQSKAFAKSLLNLQISVFAIFSWDEEEGSMLGPWALGALGALGLCGRSLCACFAWRHFPGVPCSLRLSRDATSYGPARGSGGSQNHTTEQAKRRSMKQDGPRQQLSPANPSSSLQAPNAKRPTELTEPFKLPTART